MAWEQNKLQIGQRVEVLIGNSEGRKDDRTNRLTGRARDSRLVHIDWPENLTPPRPGDLVWAQVTDAKPYFLIADAGTEPEVKRTRAGDAFENSELASCAVQLPAAPRGKGVIDLNVSVKSND
jgi:tRNA-2-methylthio-N6-dimethylallyladenosine synthase